jgi:hypothetical protein
VEPRDQALIRDDLEARRKAAAKLPWSSMAASQLAEFVRQGGDPVEAHRIAEAGQKAFPSSPGGQRCLSMMRLIEAPEVQIEAMRSDGPGKRSILVTHKNLGAVHLRAWAVDLFARIGSADDYNLLPGYNEMRSLVRGTKPTAEWKVDLPATPDFQQHRTWITPPLDKKGLYVIVASVQPDFREKMNRLQGVNFLLSDLVLVHRSDASGAAQVTAVSGESGKPIAGAEVFLYRYDYQRRHHVAESVKTDASGQHTFAVTGHSGSYFLVGRNGADLAVSGDSLYFNQPYREPKARGALIFTDRGIYRPLQTVMWKVVGYDGDARTGSFRTTPSTTLVVRLRDANNEVVEEKKVTTNAFGTAAGTFALPAGRLLGGWRLETDAGGEKYQYPHHHG